MAYLYIRENKDAEAAYLLEKATSLLEEKYQKLEQLTKDENRDLQAKKHSIFKNLGWVRFKQNRNEDAINNLSIAKNIADNKDYQKYIRNPRGGFFFPQATVLTKLQATKNALK